MAKKKRKKYPKLPNGYGSITYLGDNRRNPYAVYPPATEYYSSTGQMKHPKALCYVRDWNVGFAVLTAYKAGNYVEGMEKDLNEIMLNNDNIGELAEKILADHALSTRADKKTKKQCPTFAEVYEKYFIWKFNGKKIYSESSKNSSKAAFQNCSVIHEQKINELTYSDLQRLLDSCELKHSSLELINSLLKQMFKYAIAEGIVEKNPTELLKINIEDDDEHGVPFTDTDLKILWNNNNDEVIEAILIMCYSGFRIGELYVIDIDLNKKCFSGGLKTRTSKERIVPIHSSILPIVASRIKEYGALITISQQNFRKNMYSTLERLGIERHTPHDCRHTFSKLCEQYDVKENDRKRMLGHKFDDITNSIYGHRSLEELQKEIEKIKVL